MNAISCIFYYDYVKATTLLTLFVSVSHYKEQTCNLCVCVCVCVYELFHNFSKWKALSK